MRTAPARARVPEQGQIVRYPLALRHFPRRPKTHERATVDVYATLRTKKLLINTIKSRSNNTRTTPSGKIIRIFVPPV